MILQILLNANDSITIKVGVTWSMINFISSLLILIGWYYSEGVYKVNFLQISPDLTNKVY